MNAREMVIHKLFKTVYDWGRVGVVVDENAPAFREILKELTNMTAQECYLQCLAAECGEGPCAEAIKEKFNLKGIS